MNKKTVETAQVKVMTQQERGEFLRNNLAHVTEVVGALESVEISVADAKKALFQAGDRLETVAQKMASEEMKGLQASEVRPFLTALCVWYDMLKATVEDSKKATAGHGPAVAQVKASNDKIEYPTATAIQKGK